MLNSQSVGTPDAVTVARFTSDSLRNADERARAQELGKALVAATLKGMLYRADPKSVALNPDPAGLETAAAVAVQQIKGRVFDRLKPRLQQLAKDDAKLRQLCNFSLADLKRAGVAEPVRSAAAPAPAVQRAAAKAESPFKHLHLNVRALHCVDETNPEEGDDDMLLGAIRIGASGNVDYTPAVALSSYDDNVRREFGELPFGRVSLRSTDAWPKTFYWLFQLVEADTDEADAVAGITEALATAVRLVATAAGATPIGVIVGAIISALGSIVGLFIDDDRFYPYGLAVTLSSPSLGDKGYKDDHTGNISDHGGTYRIGYRLRLA